MSRRAKPSSDRSQPAVARLFAALHSGARAAVPRLVKRNAQAWTPALHWRRLFPLSEAPPASRAQRIGLLRQAIAAERMRARGGPGAGFAPACPNRMLALKGALLAERLEGLRQRASLRQLRAAE